MTELTITPKIADKTARFKGAVAAGEHVAVTIKGGAAWLGDDNGEHLSLRVLDLVTGRTLAVFPRPTETLEDGDDPDEWSTSTDDPNDLFCNLNLNTDRMVNAARHMLRGPVLFVMGAKDEDNPATTRTLYFRDRHEVEFWPERVGDDTPYDLDRWPKQIDEWTELIAEFETRIDAAEDSIRDAVDEANGIVAHVDAAKTAAQNSATAAGGSALAAQNSASTARNWVTGGGETGDPGATNNAKYYAQQAGDAKTDAAASATSAAASATAAANSAAAASGSATSAASSAQSAAGAAEAAVETEKERAEGAESDLADAIDAEKERAEGAEALAIVNAEYDGTSRLIVFTTGGGETKTIDASAFIKDGMISGVSVSNGNLVITFNSDAGKQPISIPLAQIFNPANYYDKTAADGRFVQKETGKGLFSGSYNDLTDKPTIPPAVTVDEAITNSGNNPVKSSGIWGAIWGALAALPTGFKSLYDWCKSFFVHASAIAPKWDPGGTYRVGDICVESEVPDSSGLLYRCKKAYTATSESNAPSNDTEHWELVDVTTLIASKQDALSSTQLTNIAAVTDKADAADLRYALVAAPVVTTYSVPDAWFPITFTYGGAAYSVPLMDKDMIVVNDGYLEYHGPNDEFVSMAYFNGAVLNDIAPDVSSLQFNGVVPVEGETALEDTHTAALTDRASNRVTPADASALTLTLPVAVPDFMRDLIVRLDLTALATAPEVTFVAPAGETVTFETEDGAMPELEAGKVNLVSLTETAAGVIAVAHKTMQEVE